MRRAEQVDQMQKIGKYVSRLLRGIIKEMKKPCVCNTCERSVNRYRDHMNYSMQRRVHTYCSYVEICIKYLDILVMCGGGSSGRRGGLFVNRMIYLIMVHGEKV